MRVLVLGATGLIGGHVAARLEAEGHDVIASGRDRSHLQKRFAGRWVGADLGRFSAADWAGALAGIDAVVNCAGALQDGARDDLKAVHDDGVRALLAGCAAAGISRYVHVSAAGLADDRTTGFNRTKLAGEAAIRASGLDWIILRPGLVLAPAAYGGSALLRALAAFPLAIPAVWPDRVVQVIDMDDVATAILRSIEPGAPSGVTVDLVHEAPVRLGQLLQALRGWLGLRPAPVVAVPAFVARLAGRVADGLGWLGWRSPVRTASLEQLRMGVTGDGAAARRHLGMAPRSLAAMLAARPASVQERWFAGLYLMKPVILVGLSAFWIASGVIGLISQEAAQALLTGAGVTQGAAQAAVIGGSVIDIALGLMLLIRPWAKAALVGMVLMTGAYVAGSAIVRPDLWLDPLGPMVKAIPAALLALFALTIMDER